LSCSAFASTPAAEASAAARSVSALIEDCLRLSAFCRSAICSAASIRANSLARADSASLISAT